MNSKITSKIFFLLIFCFPAFLNAQDVEKALADIKNLKKIKPIKVAGGFNASAVGYGVNGIASRRAPFAYALNANATVTLFGQISVPFAINYTNNGVTKSGDPLAVLYAILNRTGASPKYKWVTVHIGDRALDFSKYSYSGVRWFGGGIELAPTNGLVKLALFYGRLNQRTTGDTINGTPVAPAYLRMGFGTKVEIGKAKHNVSLIVFHAEDEYYPGDIINTKFGVSPKENLVIGLKTKNQITKKLDLMIEYTSSALTLDKRNLGFEQTGGYNYFNNLGGLFTPLNSTTFNNAYNVAANYKEKYWTLGVNYLRVDPTYASLGVLTAKNDIEAYTLNATTSLFQNKVLLAGNVGTEANNLENNLAQTMRRYIGSLNLTYLIIKNLTLNLNYNNFNHSTAPSVITKSDSIKLVQINQSQGGTLNYSWGKSDFKHSAMLAVTLQESNDIKEYINYQVLQTNKVSNFSSSYTINNQLWQANGTFALLFNQIEAPNVKTISIGPSISLNKKMLQKKLNLVYTAAYLNNTDIAAKSTTLTNKITATFKVDKHHAIKVETSLINKNTIEGKGQTFTEYQGKIGYDFVF
ncbi:MAG: hypothetical protein ACKVOU_07870 [Cytophagales bacterium]